MNKASFILQAIYEPLNVKRYYKIKMGQNLFGQWEVYTSYGRIGFSGQAKLYAFESLEDSAKKVKGILQKRFKSASRIGCPYSLKDASIEKDFKARLSTISEGNFVSKLDDPHIYPQK